MLDGFLEDDGLTKEERKSRERILAAQATKSDVVEGDAEINIDDL